MGVAACSVPFLQRGQMCANIGMFHNSMHNKAIRSPSNISLNSCESCNIVSILNVKLNSNS